MHKRNLFVVVVLGGLLAMPALAVERQAVELVTPGTERQLQLPAVAGERAPVIVPLGEGVDPSSGKKVEGLAVIHYKRGFHHQPGHTGGPGSGTVGTCYSFLSKGAKWRSVEPWLVNASNASGLSETFVIDTLAGDVAKWEAAAGADIFGDGATTASTLIAETTAPDGVNEVYFAGVDQPGAIAVTIVWGVFSGPPSARELVEWDQVYDDVDFDWSDSGVPTAMDFENVATHEQGHALGLGHPSDSCAEETMYRFADVGETKKRTLETGDVAGAQALY